MCDSQRFLCVQSSFNHALCDCVCVCVCAVCVFVSQVGWQTVRLPWLVRELFSLNQLGPPASLQSSQCRPHGLTPTLKGAIQPHTARHTWTRIRADTHAEWQPHGEHRGPDGEILKATPSAVRAQQTNLFGSAIF